MQKEGTAWEETKEVVL